jgi:hypothetical protein
MFTKKAAGARRSTTVTIRRSSNSAADHLELVALPEQTPRPLPRQILILGDQQPKAR